LKADFIGFCANMKEAEDRVHLSLEAFVRRRRDNSKTTEWFLCTAAVARQSVIKACMDINDKHLIDRNDTFGATQGFVEYVRVGQNPDQLYTQCPGDANEGFAIQKMLRGRLK
jgi:hypothetical protein